MTGPRSVRFDSETEQHLASFVARHPGLSQSSAAALLVEEGLRMDAHPGVSFREGPAGRRAVLAGGPDVWEAIRAIRSVREADPTLTAAETLDLVAASTSLDARMLQVAVAYYSGYPAEIDALITAAQDAESAAEAAVERRQALLGA